MPAPRATRRRRLPLSCSGLARSNGVIDWMSASMWRNASSSTSISLMAFPTPGIMPRRSLSDPMFLIFWSWS